MKSVLIVGAGPSGLVTAKNLLQKKGKFSVTVLERFSRVGGLWALDRNTKHAALDPHMPTNLSKFTVAFSDLSWSSVDFGQEQVPNGLFGGKDQRYVPMFPHAWQVGCYLDTYAKKYLPEGVISFNETVLSADIIVENGVSRWAVSWAKTQKVREAANAKDFLSNRTHECSSATFDYLVVASGFFAAPRPFPVSVSFEADTKGEFSPKFSNIVHSSELREISNFLHQQSSGPGNIVVIGGSMSGAEAATSLAYQVSSEQNSPSSEPHSSHNIIHICPRPFYALPPMLPSAALTSSPCSFAPLDFCLFNLGRRPDGQIHASSGKMPPQKTQAVHANFRSLIGSDQSDLATALACDEHDHPAYVAISESYAEFVRSGHITPVRGRVVRMTTDSSNCKEAPPTLTFDVEAKEGNTRISNVHGVVYATGYSPHPALDFLPSSVLEKLSYDEGSCSRLPVILDEHYTTPALLKCMAMIGFYEGPYWGVMEMQARYIANKWSQDETPTSDAAQSSSNVEHLTNLRTAIEQGDPSVPQYWMGDYLGIMEDVARELGIERNDNGFHTRSGPTTAARYVCKGDDIDEATKILNDLRAVLDASASGTAFATRAAFRAMQGKWRMKRDLKSALSTFPSGEVLGEAHFNPRYPTNAGFDSEYLYMESGVFTTQQGLTMTTSRRYVYRYNEQRDEISVWFVKEDGKTVDYLFHKLKLEPRSTSNADSSWIGYAEHHCVKDMYTTSYAVDFKGIVIKKLRILHEVEGPKKDYTSTTSYTR